MPVFSLGGLCALDIVWNHPKEFSIAGAFSGSFWWRDMDQDDKDFDEEKNRIMHRQIREGKYHPWLKFFLKWAPKMKQPFQGQQWYRFKLTIH